MHWINPKKKTQKKVEISTSMNQRFEKHKIFLLVYLNIVCTHPSWRSALGSNNTAAYRKKTSTYPFLGSKVIPLGSSKSWLIMVAFWLPSRLATWILLKPVSVQYRRSWIQSIAIPSGVWMSVFMISFLLIVPLWLNRDLYQEIHFIY